MEDFPTRSGKQAEQHTYVGPESGHSVSEAEPLLDIPVNSADAQQISYSEERQELTIKLSQARHTKYVKEEQYIDCHKAIEKIKNEYEYHGIGKIRTNISDYAEYMGTLAWQKQLKKELIALNADLEVMEARLSWLNAVLPRIPKQLR